MHEFIPNDSHDAARITSLRLIDTYLYALFNESRIMIYRYRLFEPPGYEYISESVRIITGFTPGEYYDNPRMTIDLVHPEDASLLAGLLNEVTSTQPRRYMLRLYRKDDSIIWVQHYELPWANTEGEIVAIEGIAVDVTPFRSVSATGRITERVTITEAARHLGVSPDTIRRRIRRGELTAYRQPVGRGYVWLVDVADESSASSSGAGRARATMRGGELVALLREELDARRREVQILHRLLAQAQAMVLRHSLGPPPPDGGVPR